MANIIHSIANPVYSWVLEKTSETYQNFYAVGSPQHYDGRDWGLIFMLGISLVAVLVYYFGIAPQLKNANTPNYLIVYGLGIFTLVLINCCVIPNLVTPRIPIKEVMDLNMLKFSLWDILLYTIMYEVWSLIFMPLSRDKHRHLFGILFSK